MDTKQWNAEGYDSHFKSDCHIGVKILIGIVALLLLAACGGVTPVPAPAPTNAPTSTAAPTATPRPEWTTPHPILSDVRVRRAIAYCTNKDELIQSVYPLLTPEERESLVMDSFIPKGHWAYAGEENIESYTFDPSKGKSLLQETEWKVSIPNPIRENANGQHLSLGLQVSSAKFRQTWAKVWIEQMKFCGIDITLKPSLGWIDFSPRAMFYRDVDMSAMAWITQSDPGGKFLYACDEIPRPGNDWSGLNYMGWCNPLASENIIRAEQTLLRQEKIDAYRIFQQEFTKDMVSLPLFNRIEIYAMNAELQGVELRTGDWDHYYTWNIANWEIPGRDLITLGFTQEPASLFTIIEDAYVANLAVSLVEGVRNISPSYELLPVMQKQIPTLENGVAVNAVVIVQEGDIVYDSVSDLAVLEQKTIVIDSEGKLVQYTGQSISMNQLTVKYEFVDGLKWSDGVPVSKADFELYYKIACDEESGATSFIICDSIQTIEFTDKGYTITWVPGMLHSYYFLAPYGFFPAHRVLSDGRLLADLPTKEWATTPEVARNPIGAGPYVLKEWIRGKHMIFEANPYYYAGPPKTKTIIIKFLSPAMAEPSLIVGDIDFLDSWTLRAGVSEALRNAEEEGLVKIVVVPSSTWEHIDMNLYIK